ncbi:phosphatase PAP2 family protein [Cellulomonas sp. NPDC089187]|uniref:phosphatase PAP2 family protein n=1 Tax=Cellulomonas sp. NPDC089187 TaxID=3154970 RepID=UPI0034263E38
MHPRSSVLPRALLVAILFAMIAAVSWPLRGPIYRGVAPAVAESSALSAVFSTLASYGLLILVATAGILALVNLLRNRAAFWRLVCGGVGVVVAYAASEGIKLLVTEQRPCRVWTVDTALACPAAGDWSWPSNHSVLAAAFATACLLAVRRVGWFTVPVALMIGISRLAVGVHYLHDGASGLALGTAVVAVSVVVLRPVVDRLPRRWVDAPSPESALVR